MKIITDSGADLLFSPETLKTIEVESIPLNVTLDDKTYREDIDITPEDFYKLLSRTNGLRNTLSDTMS